MRRPKYPHGNGERKAAFDQLVTQLSNRYGETVGTWLARRVAVMFRKVDDPCVDNLRVCDVSRPDEVQRYEAAKAAGCCGEYEGSATHHASGRTFRFGCNYGH